MGCACLLVLCTSIHPPIDPSVHFPHTRAHTHSKPTKDPFNPDFVKPLTFEEAYPKSTKEYLRVRKNFIVSYHMYV